MKNVLAITFVIAAGCADGLPLDEPTVTAALGSGFSATASSLLASPLAEPTVPADSDLDYERDQGIRLLGGFADSLASGPYFRVSATLTNRPGYQLSVAPAGPHGSDGTHLVASDGITSYVGADEWFVGLVMVDDSGRQLKIRKVDSVDNDGVVSTSYSLDYRATISAPWIDYCGGADPGADPEADPGADPAVDPGAIALAGSYSDQRIHQTGPWISFACKDGVAHKCNRWGYVAGNAGPNDPNWAYHQACTAMANADYCRTGVPFTRQETPILIRDYVQDYASPYPDDIGFPGVFPGNPDTFFFEAAWRPGSLQPICLSRIRWLGMPPSPCPDVLPDPRSTLGAHFCEDMPLTELPSQGAILVNASRMMDVPLQRWQNPVTGDIAETIMGYHVDANKDSVPEYERIPFPGYTKYLGLDSVVLRNLPRTLDLSKMVKLYNQYDSTTGDRVVATEALLPGHTLGDREGYAYPTSASVPTPGSNQLVPLVPLWLCRNGWDYRATITPPAGCTIVTPPGAAAGAPLGYVLPPPSLPPLP